MDERVFRARGESAMCVETKACEVWGRSWHRLLAVAGIRSMPLRPTSVRSSPFASRSRAAVVRGRAAFAWALLAGSSSLSSHAGSIRSLSLTQLLLIY